MTDDVDVDQALRPTRLEDYIGQDIIKERLRVDVQAALRRVEPLPDMLFLGYPGAGKTSLARIVAGMVGEPVTEFRGERTLKELLTALNEMEYGVLVLDELHRWSRSRQEILLPLLEDRYLDTPRGPVEFGWLTVIGGTTDRGRLIEPLQERFGVPYEWLPYTPFEMAIIILGMVDRLRAADIAAGRQPSSPFDEYLATDLAFGSAGSTRIAKYLVRTARNLEIDYGRQPTAAEVLAFCDISEDGLTRAHRNFLQALVQYGGNAGVKRIARLMRADEAAVDQLSRLLIDRALIEPGVGSQGLVLTNAGGKRIKRDAA